ncbi:hypothetical protein QOZ88_22910 [Blastococcus sp. BMG 814]|uniref:Major Facilitator Superfamily protein n=1 Tax=Blastococcus carthaginiensis TaxID=3050034 RepID=A0ABT9IIT7_9ACTN|nr:hypothetical protein [Blastococcus carthaginiensis]MDP5185494.1 hypothetical protein [Blastococcus carthaginiensis]
MALLTASHVVEDLYQGAVPALLPFLVLDRNYSYTAATGIILAATVLSSVVQPAFGVLIDRRPLPWLTPVGLLVAGIASASRVSRTTTGGPSRRWRCPAWASPPTTRPRPGRRGRQRAHRRRG